MNKYEFVILEEPQGKGRPRFRRTGHAYTPDKTRKYEQFVAMLYNGQKFDGAVRVKIKAYFKKPLKGTGKFPTKKPDADNIAKAILDALNGLAWNDDKQVVELIVTKKWAEKHPMVVVSVEGIEDEE